MPKPLQRLLIVAILFQNLSNGTHLRAQALLHDILPLSEQGQVVYTEVVPVDSATQSDLYRRAKKWFVQEYKSANDVIQLDDKEAGELVGKGIISTHWQASFMHIYPVQLAHTVTLRVKDGRYKYEISNLRVAGTMPADKYTRAVNFDNTIEEFGQNRKQNAAKFAAHVDAQLKKIIETLKKSMAQPVKNDW